MSAEHCAQSVNVSVHKESKSHRDRFGIGLIGVWMKDHALLAPKVVFSAIDDAFWVASCIAFHDRMSAPLNVATVALGTIQLFL